MFVFEAWRGSRGMWSTRTTRSTGQGATASRTRARRPRCVSAQELRCASVVAVDVRPEKLAMAR